MLAAPAQGVHHPANPCSARLCEILQAMQGERRPVHPCKSLGGGHRGRAQRLSWREGCQLEERLPREGSWEPRNLQKKKNANDLARRGRKAAIILAGSRFGVPAGG
jgi:hypothetical protein